jgi:hypothetical protein
MEMAGRWCIEEFYKERGIIGMTHLGTSSLGAYEKKN